jgi:ER lumen protein retaining receptor
LAGDLSHLLSKCILLGTIWKYQAVVGLSLNSQILYTLVFISRYLDLYFNLQHFGQTWLSVYLVIFKLVYISISLWTVYWIARKFRASYDQETDRVWMSPLIVVAIVFALIWCDRGERTFLNVMWTFSIYLEAITMIPQMYMSHVHRSTQDTITTVYLVLLGSYRAFYICNWIYRYQVQDHWDPYSVAGGIVQTIVYFCFFCVFFYRKRYQELQMAEEEEDDDHDNARSTEMRRIDSLR